MNTKIRLVRCPKCQLVLPELAEVPVYKCGGCSTVLQAKPKHGVAGESSENQDDQKQSEQVDLDEDEDKSCMQSEAFFSTELGSCDEIEKQSSVSDHQFQTHDLGTRSVDSNIGGSHPPLNMKNYYGSASSSARSSWSRSTRIPSNKLELLRMVYELEDELRQTRRMANSRYPRIPFSAEYRYQPDCSPQLRHFSALLPPPVPYPYDYCNSRYSSSQYSLHDSRQKLDEEMKKLHLREKYARMRHLRPVAGGAPILNCHYCRELVQLPAHFLLFKRKVHHLRCNACRNILKFSLQNKINLIPLYTQALTPPPTQLCEPLSSSHDTGGESFNKSTKHRKMTSHNSTLHSAPSPLHRLMGYSSPSQVINW